MTEHNNQDTLKPCPFCQSPAKLIITSLSADSIELAYCTSAECELNDVEIGFTSESWNRRAEQSQERAEALQALADEGQERGEYDMHKNPQKLYTSENCVKENEISIHKPVAVVQHDDHGGVWVDALGYDLLTGTKLYAAPLDAQAIRRKALEEALAICGEWQYAHSCERYIQALIDKEQP